LFQQFDIDFTSWNTGRISTVNSTKYISCIEVIEFVITLIKQIKRIISFLCIFSRSLDYQTEELNRLSLRSHVSTVCAKLVGLNRPMKLALLDDDTVVPYDHLLLCTGNQFRIIAPMQATVINPLSKKPVPAKADRILFSNEHSSMMNMIGHSSFDGFSYFRIATAECLDYQ
jgi:hypothetical protein